MKKVKINFYELLNFTKRSDIEKANRVKLLIEEVVNNPKFRDEILKANFKDRRFRNEDQTIVTIDDNKEILNRLISGKEQFRDEDADYEWDFRISLYRSITGEVGKRKKESVLTKKKKFRQRSDRTIAAHWIHEYIHVIGFTHDFKRTEIRPHSVPYLVGSIAKEILKAE